VVGGAKTARLHRKYNVISMSNSHFSKPMLGVFSKCKGRTVISRLAGLYVQLNQQSIFFFNLRHR
jgi:hypothetical protein